MYDVVSVGEAARRLGCSASMLRKIEAIGLAPPAQRVSGARSRIYTATEIEHIRRLLVTRRADRLRTTDAMPLTAA